MKVYKHLSEKILTFDNFMLAYHNAIRGKKHYKEVQEIEKDPEKYIKNLLGEVISKRYRVSKYTIFKRYTGHKWREIYKLPMKDRIVQHAIMNICEPIFRESFIIDTYSSIKERGIHLALKRVKKAVKNIDYKYCLKLDVHKCYPSIDKDILKNKLRRKFKDITLMWLFDIIIDSCDKGLPIGNYTSQYFNNFYFSDFDHWIKEKMQVKYYFRYCDDIVILSKNKVFLHYLLTLINQKFNLLHVKIKDNHQIFPIQSRGLDFLGFVVYPSHTKLRKRNKTTFISKITKMDFQSMTEHFIRVVASYYSLVVHADARHLWIKYTKSKTYKEFSGKLKHKSL